MGFKALLASVLLATAVSAQLSGSVGPTTPLSQKSHICNVLDYGGSVGSSDIGPAITSAFNVSEPNLSDRPDAHSHVLPRIVCWRTLDRPSTYPPVGLRREFRHKPLHLSSPSLQVTIRCKRGLTSGVPPSGLSDSMVSSPVLVRQIRIMVHRLGLMCHSHNGR